MSTLRLLPIQCTAGARTTKTLAGSMIKPPLPMRSLSLGIARSASTSLGAKAMAAAVYKVKLIGPNGEETEFEAPGDACILDSAKKAGGKGIELPYSCRAGACSTCAAKLASGSVDQSDATFLDAHQIESGYALLCVAHPTSHCVIHTHKENDLY